MKLPHLLAAALISLAPVAASAHALWIEELPEGAGLGVRFAEWGDEYETSPGNLDSFITVSAWALSEKGEPQLVNVVKQKDHFFLGKLDLTRPAFAQAQFTVCGRRPLRRTVTVNTASPMERSIPAA